MMSKAEPKKALTRRWAVAARISMIYALVAGVWIYASDTLIGWLISYSQQLTILQTYKGWLFVAVTALLLYGLISNALATARAQPPSSLDRSDLSRPASIPPAPLLWREARIPLLIFFLLAGAIGGVGYLVYEHQKQTLQNEKKAALLTIADDKVAELIHWITERRNDAKVIARDPFIALVVKRWFSAGAPADEDGKRLSVWLTNLLQDSLDYSAALLTDDKGQVRLNVGVVELHLEQQELALQAMQSDQSIMSDLHWDQEIAGEKIGIDLLAPLGRGSAGESQPVGTLLFKIDPERYLFPLIQTWPTPSPSAETLLVRREGNEVVYLNELRHRKNIPLRFRLPVSSEHLIAALAVRGQEGIIEGVDYRQVPVLAATHAVPGTAWYLVAKVDAEEVYASTRTLMLLVATVVGILILSAGMGTGLWWQQSHTRFLADRYRRELERQTLVQRLDCLAKYANDIILLIDENYRIIEVNDRALEAYGRSREELLGMPTSELRVPAARQDFQRDHEKLSREGKAVHQTWHQRRDGTPFPVEASARIIEIEGKRYYQSIIRDITERKQAEAALFDSGRHYRLLFENMMHGFAYCKMLFDDHGYPEDFIYLKVNSAFEKLTGLRNVVGKKVTEVIPGIKESNPELFAIYGRAAMTQQPEKFEIELTSLAIWFAISVYSPEKNYFVAIFDNITERKEIENEIHHLNAELEQQIAERTAELTAVNKELEAFAYSVSHDLRAPLRHIDGFIGLLRKQADSALNSQAHRYLDIIGEAAKKMGALIDNLLTFSRMGRAELVRRPVNMEQLVKDVIQELESEARERSIVWSVGVMPAVEADPTMLRIVLMNLLDNAVKFTGKREQPRIEVGGLMNQPGEIVFFVRDNGAGFDMRYADKLFGVFQRLHRTDEFEGTGIGLANVKRIIHRHGGRVWAESQVDAGATFYFSLPVPTQRG